MGKSLLAVLGPALALVLLAPAAARAQEQDKQQPPAEKKDPAADKKDDAPDKKEPHHEGKPLSDWLNLVKDKDNENRGDAALALAKMGRDARPAASSLVAMLRDEKDGYGRRLAAYVLNYVQASPELVGPPLVRALKDRDSVVRRQAASALANLGPKARNLTKDLVANLKDPDPDVRQLAAYVLGNIEPDPRDVVQPLIDASKDKVDYVRRAVAEALKKIDPEAASRAGIS